VPGDIAGRLSEGVPNPTPLAPSYLDVDSFLLSSCSQFFIPYDLWPVDAHDGPQAPIDERLQLLEAAFVTLHLSEP